MSYRASTPELKTGTANTRQGSQEQAQIAPEPMAYLRLDTGEVIGVPAGDITTLNNEFDQWNRLIYEQLLANEVLAVCDARLEAIARELAINEKSIAESVIKEAEKTQGFALEWREQATEKLRTALTPLDKLGGTGKKLIELVPLMEKEGDKPANFDRGKEDGQWKRDGTDLKKSWSFKSAAGIRDKITQQERYMGLGPLRVVSSDKLKASWPKFKDDKSMKWAEVYKEGKDGKRKIDRTKMRQYLGEQVQGLKLKSKDFFKLEISNTGTLGPEALANWNANATFSQEGKLVFGDTQLATLISRQMLRRCATSPAAACRGRLHRSKATSISRPKAARKSPLPKARPVRVCFCLPKKASCSICWISSRSAQSPTENQCPANPTTWAPFAWWRRRN